MADTIFTQVPDPRIYPSETGMPGQTDDFQEKTLDPFLRKVLPESVSKPVLDLAQKTRAATAPKEGPSPVGATYSEFLKSQEQNINRLNTQGRRAVQERVFEEGLSGERDINTLFKRPVIKDPQQYEAIKEAWKAEQAGAASPDQVAILNDARTGRIRRTYSHLLRTNRDLFQGIDTTGGFPQDLMTGKPLTGDTPMNSMLEANIARKNETALYLKEWMKTRPDAPVNKEIRNAIMVAMDGDMSSILAERMYSLANATKEGIGFYLPYAVGYAANWVGERTLGVGDTSGYTDEKRQKELMEFRDAFPMFADRTTVMNDILRDQLRIQLGEDRFNQLGLGEKITEDGIEKYKVNFVTDSFANDLFEELLDKRDWEDQLSIFILENFGAFKAITAPFVLTGNLTRAGTRGYLNMRGAPVPINAMRLDDAAAYVANQAAWKGVPIPQMAKEIVKENSSYSVFTNMRNNHLTRVIAGEAGAVELGRLAMVQDARIVQLEKDFAKAAVGTERDVIENEINRQISERVWKDVSAAGVRIRRAGIHPTFDVGLGVAQVLGRQMFDDNPMLGELVYSMTYLGGYATGKLFKFQGVPIATRLTQPITFRAKLGIEALAAGALEFTGIARKGHAQGWLINPHLREVINMTDKAKANLSPGELRRLEKFTNGLKAIPEEHQEAMIESLNTTFRDIDQIVSDLPIVEQEQMKSILALNIAEASHMSLFYGMAASADHAGINIFGREFVNVKKRAAAKIATQVDGEKKLAALANTIERLDNQILKIREGGQASIESLNRLEALSTSFKVAFARGNLEQDKLAQANIDSIKAKIAQLENPVLDKTARDQSLFTGEVNDLLDLLGQAERRFDRAVAQSTATDLPDVGAPIDTRMDVASLEARKLREAASAVDNAIINISDATIEAASAIRLSSDAPTVVKEGHRQMIGLVKMARAASSQAVTAEYAKLSNIPDVEFTNTAVDIMGVFRAWSDNKTSNVVRAADEGIAYTFGGEAGKRFVRGMNVAATKGLNVLFSDPRVRDILSESVTGKPGAFASASDVVTHLKEEYYALTHADLIASLPNGKLSDLQLALLMIEDTNLNVAARNLRFSASPKDMEDLRQTANRLASSNDEAKKTFGMTLKTNIDKTLEAWGQGLNTEAFNNVARARIFSRLEAQRFDKGTLGYEIERLSNNDIMILAGDGNTADLTPQGRLVTQLIDPLVKNIVNPTATSAASVEAQLQRIYTTFSPLSSSLPPSVLVKGEGGRLVVPDSIQISEMTTPVFDKNSYRSIQAILSTGIRNAFIESRNMKPLYEAARNSTLPSLKASDMPKPVSVPEIYGGDLFAYLDDISDQFKVKVDFEDGKGPVEVLLFDVSEILHAERRLEDVIHASAEYRQTHADMLSIAKTTAQGAEITEAATKDVNLQVLAEIGKSSEKTVGRSFFDKVIMSGDATEMNAYLVRARAKLGENKTTEGMQALFAETLKAAGERTRGVRSVRLPNGQVQEVESFARPDIVFSLVDDAITGMSAEGRNFAKLAEAAGVSLEQLKTFRAVFRTATKLQSVDLAKMMTGERAGLAQTTKGFTLDNTLSKAFNLARGMVSKEYVAAEMALRYAALTQGKMINLLIKDPRTAEIAYNILTDPTRVVEKDALYFATSTMKFIGANLREAGIDFDKLILDANDDRAIEQYWQDRGVIWKVEPDFFETASP